MTPTDPAAPPLDSAAVPTPVGPSVDPLAEPTFEECVEERNRYTDDLNAGRLDFTGIPDGHHVAYYAGQVLDHDADPVALRDRVAAALGVHWARPVIDYPWMW